ncbi:alcohol dehydrogenase, class IV [Bellilinea caldifistulae]|uniref:NADH-ubiquinone oxidoreductase subunit 6 n=1 Tax=Bellilinea caldifistulae TaxID=360411 RepID=A0A0N8GKW3_9CHLR|nr:iron-containing alcohol dehydrogenase [Bellilinea caldifistulae]KPL70818.1 NADH-ubiquinone oxidoreductase subunit 6 [Bellilinea caldifistulae]GAP10943.1 alcohol dehydrogenase, class IV [Bellilinea caldifistulae]
MWYFSSPLIVFGEDALSHLASLTGSKAMIVSDVTLNRLGLVQLVFEQLKNTGMQMDIFDEVQPDPDLETVKRGAQRMFDFQPDWIIAIGGGSVIDAAKGMWVLYARPDVQPDAINPIEFYGLRQKARLVAIPTTSGTGAEVTWAVVLSDHQSRRKLGLGSREVVPDIAIIDPQLIRDLPARISADTGLDALTHAIEGFTSTYHNDFTDGLCVYAAKMVFEYLPRAYFGDQAAREKMHYAATIARLGFGNSMAALAHGLGHALGAVFHVPHGRAVSLFLPYTIEFCANSPEGGTRYLELSRFIGLPAENEKQAAAILASRVRKLEEDLNQPLCIADLGIDRAALEAEMELLVENALNDTQTIMSTRIPDDQELRWLFQYAFEGKTIDF